MWWYVNKNKVFHPNRISCTLYTILLVSKQLSLYWLIDLKLWAATHILVLKFGSCSSTKSTVFQSWFCYVCLVWKSISLFLFFQKMSPEELYDQSWFKNFTKFLRKHVCWSLFLTESILKKAIHHKCFHVNFAKFIRTPL